MYIGTGKPHTTLVVEHTFLLCKPDAEQYHRYILQTVSDAGFQVLAKSFIITPALAEDIASTFQSVRKRMSAERGGDKLFHSGGKSLVAQSEHPPVYSKRKDGMEADRRSPNRFTADGPLGISAGNSRGKENDNNSRTSSISDSVRYSEGIIKRDCDRESSHQGIMAEILRLTSRHADGEGVNAGLPNAADEGHVADKHSVAVSKERDDDDRMQNEEGPERHLVRGTALKNTMIEGMSYQELLRENIRHLACGGTCLAVELSRHNAVERLLEIVGPENPIDARRVAPSSIRARLGTDLIRNAVYAASNLAEASHCISAVFGFSTHYSAADIRSHATMPASGGVKNNEGAIGTPAAVRPYCELVGVPHRGPPSAGALFRVGKANPQAHVSYYTGLSTSEREGKRGGNNSNNSDGEEDAGNGYSWRQKAEQLEQQLAQERADLTIHAKLLRARELDLLLREHALEKATSNLLAPAHPFEEGRESNSLPHISSRSMEDQMGRNSMLPAIMQGRQGFSLQGNINDTPLHTSLIEPHTSVPRETFYDISGPGVRGLPPVIEAEDVTLLLSKPVRLRALYVALKYYSGTGELMQADVVGLYERSPAVQLLWRDDHLAFFQRYVESHTVEPISFDSFVTIVMFLLKQ